MADITADDVRQKIREPDPSLTDAVIEDIIDDVEAVLRAECGRDFANTDNDWQVYLAADKTFCAMLCLIRFVTGLSTGAEIAIANEFRVNTDPQYQNIVRTISIYQNLVRGWIARLTKSGLPKLTMGYT